MHGPSQRRGLALPSEHAQVPEWCAGGLLQRALSGLGAGWGSRPPFASLPRAVAAPDVWASSARRALRDGELALRRAMSGFAEGGSGGEGAQEMQMTAIGRASIGAAAGGIAGGFANAALHPIDTVKTKLQARGAAQLYDGPFDVVRKVLASQGISGLYSGVHAAFWGSALSSSIYFGTYESAKGMFSAFVNLPKMAVPPLAAGVGNIVSSAVLVPKEVVKQRMQAGAIGSTAEVFLQIVQSEGVSGLYMGYSAALLRNLPSNVISFSTFEFLKHVWLRRNNRSLLAPWQSLLSGALAGALSAAITTPLDVVKTRLMTQARIAVSSSGLAGVKAEAAARSQAIAAYTYSGVFATFKQIWMEEGSGALMKGIVPRVFYSACFTALGFFMFESIKTFLVLRHLGWRGNSSKFLAQSEKFTISN